MRAFLAQHAHRIALALACASCVVAFASYHRLDAETVVADSLAAAEFHLLEIAQRLAPSGDEGKSSGSVLHGGVRMALLFVSSAVACFAFLSGPVLAAAVSVLAFYAFAAYRSFGYRRILDWYATAAGILNANPSVQLLVLGSAGYYADRVSRAVIALVRPLFVGATCSVTVDGGDPNYAALLDFITEKFLASTPAHIADLRGFTKLKRGRRGPFDSGDGGDDGDDDGGGSPAGAAMKTRREPAKFQYQPLPLGVVSRLEYRGHEIMYWRGAQETGAGGGSMAALSSMLGGLMGGGRGGGGGGGAPSAQQHESIRLQTAGTDTAPLKHLIADAMEHQRKKETGNVINVFVAAAGGGSASGPWQLALKKPARSRDSIVFDVDDTKRLLDDARQFFERKQWYEDRGIPHRRGYLLYGAPGCGKTSFAQVLAGELQLDMCILNLTSSTLTDDSLAAMLREAPSRSIIVLEDVDAIFVSREEDSRSWDGGGGNEGVAKTTVSFSGLLNAIDGVAAQEGRIFYMTTNHIENLDPALIRPGRCDVRLEVKPASKMQLENMFLRFHPNCAELAAAFAMKLPPETISMAKLQGYFLHGYTAQECVDRSMDLLLSDRAKPKQTTTIYDHLLRLGLERYASLLEFHGIATWADMQSRMYSNEGFSVQTELVPLSISLKYDEWAVSRFTSVVSGSGQVFYDSAMAEISDIRDAFLDAFPTDHELVHEERAPLLRLQQTKSVGATPIEVVGIARSLMRSESESNPWAAVAGAGAGDAAAHGGAGLLSFSSAVSAASASASASASHAAAVLPPSLTLLKRASESFYSGSVGDGSAGGSSARTGRALDDAELDRLSLAFVDALTRNGRGAVSHFNLRQILAAHPNRPVECVRAARSFVRERPIESHLLPQMSVDEFLKRAGLWSKQRIFAEVTGICTVEGLVALNRASNKATAKMLMKRFELEEEQSYDLAEILSGTKSSRGGMIYFSLHFRPRIINTFFLFYMTLGCAAAADEYSDDEANSSPASASVSTLPAPISTSIGGGARGAGSRAAFSEAEIKSLAFDFAVAVSDPFTFRSRVSLFEIRNYLRLHAHDPRGAVAAVARELLRPPRPAPLSEADRARYTALEEKWQADVKSGEADADAGAEGGGGGEFGAGFGGMGNFFGGKPQRFRGGNLGLRGGGRGGRGGF